MFIRLFLYIKQAKTYRYKTKNRKKKRKFGSCKCTKRFCKVFENVFVADTFDDTVTAEKKNVHLTVMTYT